MPRTVSKDKCTERVESASKKGSARGSGTAGGALKQVNFTPGKNTIYNAGRK